MIRQDKVNEGGFSISVRQLDGIHDVIDVATRRIADGEDDLGNGSITGDFDFTGTRSLEEAVELAEHGWPGGMEKISKIAESITVGSELLQSALKVETYFDVAGDEPDIDRFLEGSPDNMVNYVVDQQTHGRVLDFVVNVSQHARVDKKEIQNRGAAILAAVEALKSSGYSIGVLAIGQSTPSKNYYDDRVALRYEIPLLEPGQSVNVDTLAFGIMHPSFLRRLVFALKEREKRPIREKYGFRESGDYGVPMPIKDYRHSRPAHIVDKDDGLSSQHKQTVKFAEQLVVAALATLNVNAGPDGNGA